MTLSFLPAARGDIYKQFEYLLKEASPSIALRFRTQVEVAANEAVRNPRIGTPVIPRSQGHAEVRSWPVPTFPAIRIYYTQQENEIRILRVLHGKRNVARIIRQAKRLP